MVHSLSVGSPRGGRALAGGTDGREHTVEEDDYGDDEEGKGDKSRALGNCEVDAGDAGGEV